ncbi:SDR family NAD(P)-dependent oxidoreductase [Streptomyces sp. NPDC005921]
MFARQGATVVVTARRDDKLRELAGELRARGAEASHRTLDVRDGEEVRRTVEFVVERYGRLDAAFNNAGVALPKTPRQPSA